jgi:hypothetical protein
MNSKKGKIILLSMALAVVLAVAGTAIAVNASRENERIAALQEKHDNAVNETARIKGLLSAAVNANQSGFYLNKGITVSNDGLEMFLDSWGNDSPWTVNDMHQDVTLSILDQLEVPAVLKQRMTHTNMLMGTQSGTWGEFSATWTYNPGAGLDVTISTITQLPEIPIVE